MPRYEYEFLITLVVETPEKNDDLTTGDAVDLLLRQTLRKVLPDLPKHKKLPEGAEVRVHEGRRE